MSRTIEDLVDLMKAHNKSWAYIAGTLQGVIELAGINPARPLDEIIEMQCAKYSKPVKIEPKPCASCDGVGDHGVEEDTGCQMVCYACYGTGVAN